MKAVKFFKEIVNVFFLHCPKKRGKKPDRSNTEFVK